MMMPPTGSEDHNFLLLLLFINFVFGLPVGHAKEDDQAADRERAP
jgi:hypothetical protein